MAEWWRHLKGRPFYWVLDGSDPAAAYYILRYVVERPDEARALKAARLALLESPAVAMLKAQLVPSGAPQWSADYHGALWALRLLAEWGHPGDDETIAAALDGALSVPPPADHPYADVLVLHSAIAFGFYSDERVQSLSEKMIKSLSSTASRPAPRHLALLAMALAALPPEAISRTHLVLLELALATLTPTTVPEFAMYAYPTYDTPDALTVAESALRLGMRGAWLGAWVAQIVAAQDEQGLWRAHRVHTADAEPNRPNRWISAKALYVLRAYYGD